MQQDDNNLDEIIKKLQEEDDPNEIKKWNESIIYKIILLFPILIFLITFLSINNDKSIIDLIAFILFGGGLVLIGVLLNYLISDK
tara:strand:+ start:78 stop:332 length:255 start_codon:yes stop_codon:yes gene_type:complete